MPWRGSMDPRLALIIDVEQRGYSAEEAAKIHGVARSCAYKWLRRYRTSGLAGLEELSRAPYRRPQQSDEEKIRRLLKLKARHPDYGPAKLVAMIENETGRPFMAPSTAGTILDRHGLVRKRRPRRRGAGLAQPEPFVIDGPGHSMTTDYKGQFRMGDGRYCYPLTIVEPVSRYIFDIKAFLSTAAASAKPAFERVFREHGVPTQIISDNGAPFASVTSLGGLTELSKWWIDLGSTPVRIERGKPHQNGRHERMHRTLKDRIAAFPQDDLRQQQKFFNRFREEFNQVRPHQSLGQKPPASMLEPYKIEYPRRIGPAEYSELHTPRTVRSNGQIKWAGDQIFVSEVLIGERIGLVQIDESLYEIYYRHIRLGYLDERAKRVANTRRDAPEATASNDETAEEE